MVQAIFFYIPRCLWKLAEGGKIKMLVTELESPIVDEGAKTQRKDLLVSYFALNYHKNNWYAVKYFVCEFLNFVNVIGQIYFTDRWVRGLLHLGCISFLFYCHIHYRKLCFYTSGCIL